MKEKILITDSLFIFSEHEKMLRDSGYEIDRLDKPMASEEELIERVRGKAGYIVGGIEKVTTDVINAADKLKAIVFTGADWKQFIQGYELAIKRGIHIANAPGANSFAVAEYAITLILAMTRNIFELGRTGNKKFQTTHSLNDLTVGIVGIGRIGMRVASMLNSFGAKKILYYSRTRKPDIEKKVGVIFTSLNKLLSESDIVTLHVSKDAGDGFIGEKELVQMKDGSLLINCGFTGTVERDALLKELKSGRLRAAQDDPFDSKFDALPISVWFNSNAHTAYNTFEANKVASDMATQSMINLLSNGKDRYEV